jgi:hypothetical protein
MVVSASTHNSHRNTDYGVHSTPYDISHLAPRFHLGTEIFHMPCRLNEKKNDARKQATIRSSRVLIRRMGFDSQWPVARTAGTDQECSTSNLKLLPRTLPQHLPSNIFSTPSTPTIFGGSNHSGVRLPFKERLATPATCQKYSSATICRKSTYLHLHLAMQATAHLF